MPLIRKHDMQSIMSCIKPEAMTKIHEVFDHCNPWISFVVFFLPFSLFHHDSRSKFVCHLCINLIDSIIQLYKQNDHNWIELHALKDSEYNCSSESIASAMPSNTRTSFLADCLRINNSIFVEGARSSYMDLLVNIPELEFTFIIQFTAKTQRREFSCKWNFSTKSRKN